MTSKNVKSNRVLIHSGKKGMKWGYNNGSKNGKRTAVDIILTKGVGVAEKAALDKATDEANSAKESKTKLFQDYNNTYNSQNVEANSKKYDAFVKAGEDYVRKEETRKLASLKYDKTLMGKTEKFLKKIFGTN